MFANYHTHTARCGHATGEDREYVEAAIRSGIRVLGFSDHCPWVYPDGYKSHIRMTPDKLDGYFSSLISLREEYSHDITIYIGLEAEYIPELMDAQDVLLSGYPLDYMILGEHFTQREPLGRYTGRPTADESDLIRYVDMAIEGLSSGRYTYLAHPDLIYFTGDTDVYDQQMTRLCRFLKENELPVELNMLGAAAGRNYPGRRFLSLAQKVGNTAIIAADAHYPEALESTKAEQLCQRLAKRFDLQLIDRLPGMDEKQPT